ncbi:nitrilase-related carbon-nitrogen hydrolase [uncultured Aureimonas sp.]|uniref:nitrilase-related carbon-nitrogen hydrolase n=1 Tax=uncultured Aureimonas sp. TaxID=1604662 RepID=UPI0025FB3EB0|nr:nitrilase-related carbon-nitrogen hydrolase [uncultured Aureimonas sp.]
MRVALFQLDAAAACGGADGLLGIDRCLAQAREAGADLAHLPELALPGYGAGAQALQAEAERATETIARLQARVEETRVALALGLPVADGAVVSNAAVFLRPGEAPVVYAKRFLYGDYERGAFSPGTAISPVVAFGAFRVGLLVCFDVEFPETVRALAQAGADLVLVPTALPESEGARFIARSLVPTRAFENSVFLSYADWSGQDGTFAYQGLSVIAGPDGAALARGSEAQAEMLVADLDPAAFAGPRAANNYLGELADSTP